MWFYPITYKNVLYLEELWVKHSGLLYVLWYLLASSPAALAAWLNVASPIELIGMTRPGRSQASDINSVLLRSATNEAWERDWVLTTSYYACTIQTHSLNPVQIGEAKRSLLPSFLLRSQLVWLFLSFFTLSFHAQTSQGKRSMIVGLFFMRCIKTINYPQVEP